jgi:hypothetical protein
MKHVLGRSNTLEDGYKQFSLDCCKHSVLDTTSKWYDRIFWQRSFFTADVNDSGSISNNSNIERQICSMTYFDGTRPDIHVRDGPGSGPRHTNNGYRPGRILDKRPSDAGLTTTLLSDSLTTLKPGAKCHQHCKPKAMSHFWCEGWQQTNHIGIFRKWLSKTGNYLLFTRIA